MPKWIAGHLWFAGSCGRTGSRETVNCRSHRRGGILWGRNRDQRGYSLYPVRLWIKKRPECAWNHSLRDRNYRSAGYNITELAQIAACG